MHWLTARSCAKSPKVGGVRSALALLAGLAAAGLLAASEASPAGESGSKCQAMVIYRGVTYFGLEGSHLGLRAGRSAGVAREPYCDDTPGSEPGTPMYRRVPVRRIAGVRPRVAIARRDVPNVIYIAADRCKGNLGSRALVRCLRRSR